MENNKYNNGKIYRITDLNYTKCYIGSTTQLLCSRMSMHRYVYKKYLEGSVNYISSFLLFEEFGVDNCKIELIEEYACENKEQLRKREGHYIQDVDCVNKHVAGRSKQEYAKYFYENNIEKINEYKKEWYQLNLDRVKEYKKEYREKNRDKLNAYEKQYREQNHEKLRNYREQNKDRKKQTDKEYREKNKEKIKERMTKQIECPFCKSIVQSQEIRRHQRTKKCLQSRETEYQN